MNSCPGMNRSSVLPKCSLHSPAWDSFRSIIPSHPKTMYWDNSFRTCSKSRNFQVLQDFGKVFLPTASTGACILWLQRVLLCFQVKASLLAQELPMHRTVSPFGFKGEDAVSVDWMPQCSPATCLVSGSKPVQCVAKHACITSEMVQVQWTCDARKDAAFLIYLSISYGGQPLWGEIIYNHPLETMPSIQVHSYCGTWEGRE